MQNKTEELELEALSVIVLEHDNDTLFNRRAEIRGTSFTHGRLLPGSDAVSARIAQDPEEGSGVYFLSGRFFRLAFGGFTAPFEPRSEPSEADCAYVAALESAATEDFDASSAIEAGSAAFFGTAALALLTFYVMSKSFLKLATASSDTVTAKYNRNARQKASGVFPALLKREFSRFTASPAYMLNCGFGVIIMPIAGILLLIRGAALRSMLFGLFDSNTGTIAILAAAAVCLVSTMNDMTAPSVSLEGKTLWILRSMPVTTQQILRAKLAMQLLLSGISVLFAAICTCIAFAVPIGSTIAVILACLSLVVLLAEFGLFLDLKKPNLNWTTEITPIKQSSSVMFALFGGWLYVLLFGAGWFLSAHALGAELYLMLFFALNMILSAVLRSWLMRSGTDIFESL